MRLSGPSGGHRSLLLAVAEQLKIPLTSIARQAELGLLVNGAERGLDAAVVATQAAAALTLVDSYLLGLELSGGQAELALEPVPMASLLTDTAHELERFAVQYGVQLEVAIAGKYAPVMAHARGCKAMLLSLGFALVEAQAGQDMRGPRRVVLATHRTPHGLVSGVYGRYDQLRAKQWQTALTLMGQAGQPLPLTAGGNGAGLFVADTIARSMNSRLRVGKFQRHSGLAATFQPSRQLQFV